MKKNGNQSPGIPKGKAHRSKSGKDIKLRQAELLLSISQKMAAYETLDEMLTVLVDITTRELNAERGTIFLNDDDTKELYSRVAHGNFQREIRFLNNTGVAGHVYTTGEGIIANDAYDCEYFNPSIDEMTGYITRSILCAPIKTVRDEIIGVSQILNKKSGEFAGEDLSLLEAITTQALLRFKLRSSSKEWKNFVGRKWNFLRSCPM